MTIRSRNSRLHDNYDDDGNGRGNGSDNDGNHDDHDHGDHDHRYHGHHNHCSISIIIVFSYGLTIILILTNWLGGGLTKSGGSLKVMILPFLSSLFDCLSLMIAVLIIIAL